MLTALIRTHLSRAFEPVDKVQVLSSDQGPTNMFYQYSLGMFVY